MIFSHAPWLVLSVLGLTVVWLCLVAYFLRYVRTQHPAEFQALGEPSFQHGALRVISYVYCRGHRPLRDSRFSLLCDAMLVCFTAVVGLGLYAIALGGGTPSVRSGP
jgi:hypothetical protein